MKISQFVPSRRAQPAADELTAFLSSAPEMPEGGNVMQWWQRNRSTFPQLSRMAQDFLSIPGKFIICGSISADSIPQPPLSTLSVCSHAAVTYCHTAAIACRRRQPAACCCSTRGFVPVSSPASRPSPGSRNSLVTSSLLSH